MIQYRLATIEEVDFLVQLRLQELALFTDVPFPIEHKNEIKLFYKDTMRNRSCFTLLGYDQEVLVATGTIYFQDCLPSNANPIGRTGYITNIWTHDAYRRQGIGTKLMDRLLEIGKEHCGMICLNTSAEGQTLYLKKGFKKNEQAMVYRILK